MTLADRMSALAPELEARGIARNATNVVTLDTRRPTLAAEPPLRVHSPAPITIELLDPRTPYHWRSEEIALGPITIAI